MPAFQRAAVGGGLMALERWRHRGCDIRVDAAALKPPGAGSMWACRVMRNGQLWHGMATAANPSLTGALADGASVARAIAEEWAQ